MRDSESATGAVALMPRIDVLARMVIALAMLAAMSAWAQQPVAAEPGDVAGAPSATTAEQPMPAAPLPKESSESSAQAADDDAQLPAYLRRGATDANNVAYDPWERYNRRIYRFNKKADHVAKWAAQTYVRIAPEPVRNSVGRFYENLGEPISAANLLLQGHPVSACKSLGRFAVNATIGIGGLFDPATRMRIPAYDEDFGQTLGRWGWRRSRYLMLPFFGPSTLRDRLGTLADSQLGPSKYFHPVEVRVGLAGLELIDKRAQILPLEDLGASLEDEYVLVREAWTQHRIHQINDQTVNALHKPLGIR